MSSSSLALWTYVVAVFFLTINPHLVHGQENAQTSIPSSLSECYENPEIYERDNRLPATINMLIELIRKIEDSADYTQDIRQVAVALLHRFRMDGIEHATGNYHRFVLPFSPSGYQFSKHRLLLSRLIPGNANNFPNDTLSATERCALHFLISSSIDNQVRGDEATRCGQLAQFRSSSLELSRRKRHYVTENNYLCDIEMMHNRNDQGQCQRYRKQFQERHGGRVRTTTQKPIDSYDYNSEVDDTPDDYPFDSRPSIKDLVDVASNAVSQCPVENGVLRTTWGAVATGPLIAGIAAGLVQQNVAARELLLHTRYYVRHNVRQQVQLNVDNRFAATLAGDLAEITLLQGPMSREISVGAPGAWNSTTVPHWYFLSQRERLEMTDAEIRGGIDGIVLGMNIAEWRRQTSQLRLSQLLDMYYSRRGVLASKYRSCERRDLFTKAVDADQLKAQTIAFSTVLNREMQLRVTLNSKNIEQFSDAAANSLVSHVGNVLSGVSCDTSSNLNEFSETRIASDLHIFVDTTWQFIEVQPAIAALLENADVNRFGTRFALYNAYDGSIIVNSTSSLADFYMYWNRTSHEKQSSGLNLAAIVKQLRVIGGGLMNGTNAGGRSFIALVVPQLTGVNEADSNFAVEQLFYLREVQPDLRLLFWAGGSAGRFARFVVDQQRDIFPLEFGATGPDSSNQQNIIAVTRRLQSVPRRVINPRCTLDWQQNDWGANSLDQYVDPSGVLFYRLQSNYFYRSGGVVRVQSRYQSQIIVCTSRLVEYPRFSNTSQPTENVNCRQLLATESYDYDLSNACSGHYLIQTCPPLYISVQPVPQAAQNNFQCTDSDCRFPDQIKFSINMENLGCYSSSSKNMFSLIVLLLCMALILIKKY